MTAQVSQAKDSELIQFATEIKVRAERRCGELLAATEKNRGIASGGERTAAGHTLRPADTAPTLADMGLTKSESSRSQQLAAIPTSQDRRTSSNEATKSIRANSPACSENKLRFLAFQRLRSGVWNATISKGELVWGARNGHHNLH